jgi:hypothetical protein
MIEVIGSIMTVEFLAHYRDAWRGGWWVRGACGKEIDESGRLEKAWDAEFHCARGGYVGDA